ncbi:O-antigen ligase family protein [Streptococcus porcinus]|uniref:O-antigen ligase family protein n=1 Tax=Streptococcus porcinus TaxID=1340 RepID=UPI00155868E8|nr:O-antigen ligase family protein [Streptococcus porcinus]
MSALIRTTIDIEKMLAKIYLFLLPFRMISPLLFLNIVFKGASVNLDFIFNIIGIILCLISSKGKIKIINDESSKLFNSFVLVVIFLNVSSIMMATYIQLRYGNYAGESAYSGIAGMLIYFAQYIAMILYNIRIISILSVNEIRRVLSKISLFLLILGYYQVLTLSYKGVFLSALHSIDIFNVLWPGDFMPKLSLTGSEGASAGTIFSILILPFLLSSFYYTKKSRYILQLVVWIPVVIFMKSTSGYLMIIATLLFFLLLYNSKDNLSKIILFLAAVIVLLMFFTLGFNFFKEVLPQNLRYMVFEKISDKTNGSTIARLVPLYTNWKTFLDFPIFGVGNGLQGYFYIKNYPIWALNAPGVTAKLFYESAKVTIVNGGLFFPSLLSGYGTTGIILLTLFLNQIRKKLFKYSKLKNFYLTYFKIAMPAIIICGFQSEFVGNYCIWFIISLIFVDFSKYGRVN